MDLIRIGTISCWVGFPTRHFLHLGDINRTRVGRRTFFDSSVFLLVCIFFYWTQTRSMEGSNVGLIHSSCGPISAIRPDSFYWIPSRILRKQQFRSTNKLETQKKKKKNGPMSSGPFRKRVDSKSNTCPMKSACSCTDPYTNCLYGPLVAFPRLKRVAKTLPSLISYTYSESHSNSVYG